MQDVYEQGEALYFGGEYAEAEPLLRRAAEEGHAHAPYLEKVLDPGRFPLAARVGTTAGQEYQAAGDPARAFEFGLARLLDGIEVLVRDRAGAAPAAVTGG